MYAKRLLNLHKKFKRGTKNDGVKKSKLGGKKQIERWDFFDPNAAFTNGVQSDVRTVLQLITLWEKGRLIMDFD